ncbi:DUF2163 domain-containing protein [Alkanindiges illinoisensis]|uniref:DUF2163 domain-containing protein n=1 Tax=Alkanindiges illinoisensis TaxID=197183 RepID=UPI00047C48E7|nr:DUF2163 domain-containing protein [Alkanindiges illinoisensis]
MRAASAKLIQLLDANQFVMADLYTLTTILGKVYRFTNYDLDLTVAGQLYRADGPIISRDGIKQTTGIEVSSLNIEIKVNDTVLLDGVPFIQLLHNGGLDGARFKLERIFMDWQTPTDTSAGTIKLFEGRLVEPEFHRTGASFEVASDTEVLNVQMPRNLYQPGCLNTLFDSGCGLVRAAYAELATVEINTVANRIQCSLNHAQGYFTQGVVEFLSGINTGVKRTIRLHESGALHLTLPLHQLPAVGDQIRVYPGCDKRMDTCTNRFNNLSNFRGFPFVPVPETAV